MRVEYHAETASELNAAILYYNAARPGLGQALRAEVYAAIERIRANPDHFPVIGGDIRRCLVRRFPYSVLFRKVGDQHARILVIRHHRRHPGYGLKRR